MGLYDPVSSIFYLTSTLATATAERTFGYGAPGAGWLPVSGVWSQQFELARAELVPDPAVSFTSWLSTSYPSKASCSQGQLRTHAIPMRGGMLAPRGRCKMATDVTAPCRYPFPYPFSARRGPWLP